MKLRIADCGLRIGLMLALLAATVAEAVTLGWDASPGATGYRLYYGLRTGNYSTVIDAGNSLSNRVSGLVPGRTYYFAVTAYEVLPDGHQVESGYSSEVWFTVPNDPTNPPALNLAVEKTSDLSGPWEMVFASSITNDGAQMFFRMSLSRPAP